jgi:hypothetical protein
MKEKQKQRRRSIAAKLPGTQLEKGERLFHVKDWDPGSIVYGLISVATKVNFEDKTISAGFSFCSPTDDFDRRDGVRRAIGRLRKYPIVIRFENSPAQALKAFVFGTFERGIQVAQKAYETLPRKKAHERITKFFTEDVLQHPHIINIPYKGIKRFPIKYPWWWHFKFPLPWQEAEDAEKRKTA